MAVTRAANPEAEEARPQPVGKSLVLVTLSGGKSKCSRSVRRNRATFASAKTRPLSAKPSSAASATVVLVEKASNVMESDGVAGVLCGPGALPQYFTKAMLGCAMAVARPCMASAWLVTTAA